MRNKVINNRGSFKKQFEEKSILTFQSLLSNLRERAEGIKITYMCDYAGKRIKIKIKKKEKT